MPRRRMMDYLMGRPYGDMARSGRRMRRRMGSRDRAMHEDYGYEPEMEDGRMRRNSKGQYMADMGYDMPHAQRDYGSFHEERGYKPVEAMGYFTGYYGGGEDHARGGRRDYGYDYNYDMRGRDYGYDYGYDYGDSLTKEEMEHWRKKLDKEVGDEQSKNFFKKENIEQKTRTLGIEMKEFGAEELAIASYMLYSDYCKSLKPYVGQSMDVFVKMGAEFLNDPDSAVKGREKLAMYFDIVSGEDD